MIAYSAVFCAFLLLNNLNIFRLLPYCSIPVAQNTACPCWLIINLRILKILSRSINLVCRRSDNPVHRRAQDVPGYQDYSGDNGYKYGDILQGTLTLSPSHPYTPFLFAVWLIPFVYTVLNHLQIRLDRTLHIKVHRNQGHGDYGDKYRIFQYALAA
jgi:hypothetical protein